MGVHFENINPGQQVVLNDGVQPNAAEGAADDENVSHSFGEANNEQQGGAEFKPVLAEGRALNQEDLDAAEGDIENQEPDGNGMEYEEAKARFNAIIDDVPEELRAEWGQVIMLLEGLEGLGEGIPRDLESFLTVLLALLVLLVEVSSEMKKTQRDASFASMKLSVQHLVNQADHIKAGAHSKMMMAAIGGAVTIAGTIGGLSYVGFRAGEVYTLTQQAQMATQITGSTGQIIQNVGEFDQSLEQAEGTIEQSESNKDSYDSEQFKDTGNTTRELISSALNNIKELISAYKAALDHAAGNMA